MLKCTAEEIEAKRKLALEKLRAKQNGLRPISPGLQNTKSINLMYATNPTAVKNANNSWKGHQVQNLPNGTNSVGKFPAASKPSYQPYSKPTSVSNDGLKANNFFGTTEAITVTMSLVSENMFVVDQSKYFEPLITVMKDIPSRVYDPNKKNWQFSINDYEKLLVKLQLLRPNIVIEPIPTCVLDYVREKALVLPDNIDLSRIDQPLLEALMPFQRDGVCFGIQKRGRCLIADEMGLGKTFQALALGSYYKGDWPMLIVTTASMKNTWEETIQKYLPSVPVFFVKHMQSAKDYIDDTKILIVSHDLMGRAESKLLERNFGVIIIDESHMFKNFKAKGTKVALNLSKNARRVILLTGTPALSRPNELYTQISIIDSQFFSNFKNYSKRYCAGHDTRFGWNSNGQSNLQELEVILNKKFMIRRTKDEVLPQLPNKTRKIVRLHKDLLKFTDEEIRNLNIMATNLSQTLRGTDKNAALLTFFNETGKLKVKAVCSYISDLLTENRKFLIFVHHQIMLDNICELLETKQVFHIRIDGKTTSDQRSFFVNRFNSDESYKCAVLSITAANAGITLTAASLVLFGELHWNPSILTQAECRAHRIGQENPVEVQYLLAGGTADDYMWEMIQSKTDVLNAVGLSSDSFKNTETTSQNHTQLSPSSQKSIKDYLIDDKTSKANCSAASINDFDDSIFDDADDELFTNLDI